MKKMILPSIQQHLTKTNSTANPSALPYKLIIPHKHSYAYPNQNPNSHYQPSPKSWEMIYKSSNFLRKNNNMIIQKIGISKHNSNNSPNTTKKSFMISNTPSSISSLPKTLYSSFSPGKQFNSPKQCPICSATIESYLYNRHINNHPSQIFDWLYLGNYSNASSKTEMHSLNIKYVLNCAIECRNNYPKDFTYCHLKLDDRPNFRISLYLNQAADFIENGRKGDGKILVHCQMGISRSTTCVIAYMIREMNYTAIEALTYIKKRRKIICPNYGFMEQLIHYEKILKARKLNE